MSPPASMIGQFNQLIDRTILLCTVDELKFSANQNVAAGAGRCKKTQARMQIQLRMPANQCPIRLREKKEDDVI
jgi:hypothetical protein